MVKREGIFRAIGDKEYNRLQSLAKILVELGPRLEAMASVVVDAQEDLEHQGVEYHPYALKQDVIGISRRASQVFSKFEKGEEVGWNEYQEVLIELKTLISRVDPENEGLKI